VGLTVLLLLVAPLLLSEHQVRQVVVKRIEIAMKRPVAIEGVDLAFFPSLRCRLQGVRLGDRPAPGQPLVEASSINLRVGLLPLLRRQIEVTGVEIERPLLDMVLAPETQERPSGEATAPPPGGLNLRVQKLSIQDGRVIVRLPDGSPLVEIGGLQENLSASLSSGGRITLSGRTEIDSVRVRMVGGASLGQGLRPTLDKKLAYSLTDSVLAIEEATLDVAGLPIRVSGRVSSIGGAQPNLDLTLEGGPGEVREIAGLIPAGMAPGVGDLESSGTLRVSGRIAGPAERSFFDVHVLLEDGRVASPMLPQPLEGIRLAMRAGPDTLQIDEFSARAGSSRLRAKATLTQYQTPAPVYLAAVDADVDLAMLNGFYTNPDSIRLSGRAAAQIVAEGSAARPEDMAIAGTATFSGVGAEGMALPLPVRDLQGDVVLEGPAMSLRNVRTRFGKSDLAARGTVSNYMALVPPAPGAPPRDMGRARADLTVSAGLLDLNELMAQNEARAQAAGGAKGMSTADLILPPVDGAVRLSAEKILFQEIEILRSSGLVRFDRGRILAENLVCDIFGGTARVDGSVDLTTPATPLADLTADVRDAAVAQLFRAAPNLNRYGALAGHLQGNISLNAQLKGSLTDSLRLDPASLTSTGSLSIGDARLSDYPLQTAVASFLSAPQLRDLGISQWQQSFHIRDGRLEIDQLGLTAGGVDLVASGYQALDGALAMKFDLLLPANLSESIKQRLPGGAAALVTGADGRVFVPLELGGNIRSAQVSVSSERLASAAKEQVTQRLAQERARLEQEARRKAEEAISRRLPGPDSTSVLEKGKEAVKEEVKDRLGRIFGR